MYVGKSPIGNRSVSDLAIWGAPFMCVCMCAIARSMGQRRAVLLQWWPSQNQSRSMTLNPLGNAY